MLWSPDKSYHPEPFEKEAELEDAIQKVKEPLFGENRIYLEVKKLIGQKGKTQNIPDAYLIDLSSPKKPKLWVVENELASHDPLRHIAVQVLQMSLSFESTPQRVKAILKEALGREQESWKLCEEYASTNGFSNIDYLLEEMVYRGEFGALVVIDELHDELETLLVSRFKFGVEVLTLNRYRDGEGERLYQFEPFLTEVTLSEDSTGVDSLGRSGKTVDTSDIDTVVVPARDEGFEETVLSEHRWYQVRLQASMIPKIKHLAVYRVAPVSAITHVAPVESIEPWRTVGKYALNFSEPARELEKPLKLLSGGNVKAPQSIRYTSYERLMNATTMDEAF
jgi:regulator of RNase E activity RraB